MLGKCIDEAVHGAGAVARDRHLIAIVPYGGLDNPPSHRGGIRAGIVIHELQARTWLLDIGFPELLIYPLGGSFLALGIGDGLDRLAELDLQIAWQVQPVVRM